MGQILQILNGHQFYCHPFSSLSSLCDIHYPNSSVLCRLQLSLLFVSAISQVSAFQSFILVHLYNIRCPWPMFVVIATPLSNTVEWEDGFWSLKSEAQAEHQKWSSCREFSALRYDDLFVALVLWFMSACGIVTEFQIWQCLWIGCSLLWIRPNLFNFTHNLVASDLSSALFLVLNMLH